MPKSHDFPEVPRCLTPRRRSSPLPNGGEGEGEGAMQDVEFYQPSPPTLSQRERELKIFLGLSAPLARNSGGS